MRMRIKSVERRHSLGMLVTCACLMLADRADAVSMLRCESGDGSVRYVSARIGNEKCHRMNMIWQLSMPALAVAVKKAPASAARSGQVVNVAGEASEPLPVTQPAANFPRREATAKIYSYIEGGVRHFATTAPSGNATKASVIELRYMETCYLCAPASNVNVAALMLDMRSYQREIDAAASTFGVSSEVVRAVIHAESAYHPNAISRAGAQGLMQLMPATALRFGVHDAFDPEENIRGGVQYLAWLLKRFDSNLDLALAAYDSGESAVDKYGGVPPFEETRTYVSRVKALAERYRDGQ
jgi:soluble lytic murein transglycosylase-like protein